MRFITLRTWNHENTYETWIKYKSWNVRMIESECIRPSAGRTWAWNGRQHWSVKSYAEGWEYLTSNRPILVWCRCRPLQLLCLFSVFSHYLLSLSSCYLLLLLHWKSQSHWQAHQNRTLFCVVGYPWLLLAVVLNCAQWFRWMWCPFLVVWDRRIPGCALNVYVGTNWYFLFSWDHHQQVGCVAPITVLLMFF